MKQVREKHVGRGKETRQRPTFRKRETGKAGGRATKDAARERAGKVKPKKRKPKPQTARKPTKKETELGKRLAALERQLATLKLQLKTTTAREEAQRQLAKGGETVSAAEALIKKVCGENAGLKGNLRIAREEIDARAQALETLQKQLDAAVAEAKKNAAALESALELIRGLTKERDDLAQRLKTAPAAPEATQIVRPVDQRIAEALKARDDARRELTGTQDTIRRLEGKLAGKEGELGVLNKAMAHARGQIVRAGEELKRREMIILNLRAVNAAVCETAQRAEETARALGAENQGLSEQAAQSDAVMRRAAEEVLMLRTAKGVVATAKKMAQLEQDTRRAKAAVRSAGVILIVTLMGFIAMAGYAYIKTRPPSPPAQIEQPAPKQIKTGFNSSQAP